MLGFRFWINPCPWEDSLQGKKPLPQPLQELDVLGTLKMGCPELRPIGKHLGTIFGSVHT